MFPKKYIFLIEKSCTKNQTPDFQEAKAQWKQDSKKEQLELQVTLKKAKESLTEKHRKLEELQQSTEDQIKHLEAELSQAWTDRDAAARELSSSFRQTA